MVTIDGSQGEGGGQVLRTSLALSLLSGEELHLYNIRAGRKKPGLQPQHLVAVRAAADIGGAKVEGAHRKSQDLTFLPSGVFPGKYHWDIGTAGATSLVLQTVLLPLAFTQAPSTLRIIGGTHVPWSPSFHYLDLQWRCFLHKVGVDLELGLEKAGFYPEGGGSLSATIHPVNQIKPLELIERGALQEIRGISAVANLDRKIAERQRDQVIRRIGARFKLNDLRITELPARFKGTMLLLLAEFVNSQACYFSLGALGKPAERVADEAVNSLLAFLETDSATDQYLADQLLLPLAFASGVSHFTTSKITAHLLTNAAVIQAFLSVGIDIEGELGQAGKVVVHPQGRF